MAGLANFKKVKGVTKMKKKGFTLVELLVVIAIIALLMGILMPALAKVRQIAYRMVCGTHLKGIGNAIMLYANDNKDDYPIGGRKGSNKWSAAGTILAFDGVDQTAAFTAGEATVTSCLFLLIKGYELTPAMFNCKGDSGIKEFKLSDTTTTVADMALVWDFGMGTGTDYPKPGQYNSYAYHLPYGGGTATTPAYPINVTSHAGSPLCSDRNPYLDKNAYGTASGRGYLDAAGGSTTEVAAKWDGEYKDKDKTSNCATHQREGQNVLYNDNHSSFEKHPNVGVQNDNIWKHWQPGDTISNVAEDIRQVGGPESTDENSPAGANGGDGSWPQCDQDAYLVSEKNFTP
jgi:prepilin-type N-terminal cleavage/methylation domain-containing protein